MTGEADLYYRDLAVHLDPDDPARGAHAIDVAILRLLRARYARRNRSRLMWLLGQVGTVIGLVSIALPMLRWLDPQLPHTILDDFVRVFPLGLGLAVLAVSLALVATVTLRDPEGNPDTLPKPPPAIAAWLAARGKTHGLRYWHEVYWPDLKRRVHRREVFGFTFWPKQPAPLAVYEALIARDLARGRRKGASDADLKAYADHFEGLRPRL